MSRTIELLTVHWTCNSHDAGSSPGWAPPHSDLEQTTYGLPPGL